MMIVMMIVIMIVMMIMCLESAAFHLATCDMVS
jgi:hypothetical protein